MVAGVPLGVGIEGEHGANPVVAAVFGDAHAVPHDLVQLEKVLGHVRGVAEAAGLLVEGHVFAKPVRVVHQVAEHAAIVGIRGIAIGQSRIAFSHCGDEGLPVAAGGDPARFDGQVFKRVAAGPADFVAALADDHAAILKVILIGDLVLVALVVHVANIEKHHLAVGILGHRKHRVGRLALVIPSKAAADRCRFDRMRLIVVDRPASDIELVRALVVEVAIAGLPEPVPVVVHEVGVVVIEHGRALPEIPVKVGRGVAVGLGADRCPWLAAVAIGNLEPRQGAIFERGMKPCDPRIAPPLRAMLHDHAVFLGGLQGDAAFHHVVAHRLLNVDMLASLGSPDRHQGVPMVWRGYGDRVDVFVFKHLADVFLTLGGEGGIAGLLGQPGKGAIEHLLIRVDDVGDLHVVEAHEAAQVRLPTAVEADHGDANPVVGSQGPGRRASRSQQERAGGGGSGKKTTTTGDGWHGILPKNKDSVRGAYLGDGNTCEASSKGACAGATRRSH